MIKFKITGDTFAIKEEIKQQIPNRTRSQWKFNYSDTSWGITLQSHFVTKAYRTRLTQFCTEHKLDLSEKDWDGSNKENNYV